MGDAADMLLDGTLCEACGTFIDDDEPGHPRYCDDECAAARGMPPPALQTRRRKKSKPKKRKS